MPSSVFTIEWVAHNLVTVFVFGMIACKTGSLHVHVSGLRPVCAINFSRDQSSDKLINFLNSQLDTRDSRLDTQNYRGSSLEDRGSRGCQLTSERYCTVCSCMSGEYRT